MSEIRIDSQVPQLINNFSFDGPIAFGRAMMPIMAECHYKDDQWGEVKIKPYGSIAIDPAAKVLHYAQEIFEGLKAYKNDRDETFLFRPDENAKRFNASALRMAMPVLPESTFLETSKQFVKLLKNFVPKKLESSLYLRPFMIATEPALGVRTSKTYSFYLIGCLAERYFTNPSVKVYVEEKFCRAAPGGIGFAKTGGNYGASLLALKNTESAQCDQTLWLDAIEKKYIEELSGMNFFAVIEDKLITPSLTDTILAGITRKSILELATKFNLEPIELKLDIDDLIKNIQSGRCSEAFACGTASVLTPIESLYYQNQFYQLKYPAGNKSKEIKDYFLELQRGNTKDVYGWSVKVD